MCMNPVAQYFSSFIQYWLSFGVDFIFREMPLDLGVRGPTKTSNMYEEKTSDTRRRKRSVAITVVVPLTCHQIPLSLTRTKCWSTTHSLSSLQQSSSTLKSIESLMEKHFRCLCGSSSLLKCSRHCFFPPDTWLSGHFISLLEFF